MFVVITYHVVMVMVYVTSISNLSESFLVKASVFAFGTFRYGDVAGAGEYSCGICG